MSFTCSEWQRAEFYGHVLKYENSQAYALLHTVQSNKTCLSERGGGGRKEISDHVGSLEGILVGGVGQGRGRSHDVAVDVTAASESGTTCPRKEINVPSSSQFQSREHQQYVSSGSNTWRTAMEVYDDDNPV